MNARLLSFGLALGTLASAVGAAEISLRDLLSSSTAEAEATASPPASSKLLRQIAFEGNRVTQPRTMLRELPFKQGDAVTLDLLERGRQAIQDLGLFKAVQVREVAEADGSITAIYTVSERWYLLPYPRVDANADGEYAYGAQLSWNNLWGLNHTLRASALQRETARLGSSGKEMLYSASYFAPQVFDTRWSLGAAGSYTERPFEDPQLGFYNEQISSVQLMAQRALSAGPPSQGWSIGAGVLATQQRTDSGIGEYGEAAGPVVTAGYRDVRLNIYSEEGITFGGRLDGAMDGFAADYDFARLTVGGIRYLPFGVPHQTLHLIAETGLGWKGPDNLRNFSLGGSGSLRGYQRSFEEGNAFYRVAGEWARPIFKPWLRTVVIAEVGNVYRHPNEIDLGAARSSIGFGLRLRLLTFVNLEVEAGIALPLEGGAARFFAGRV